MPLKKSFGWWAGDLSRHKGNKFGPGFSACGVLFGNFTPNAAFFRRLLWPISPTKGGLKITDSCGGPGRQQEDRKWALSHSVPSSKFIAKQRP
jgi:hypothetical protein